jgi:hypothetical protein
MHEHVDLQKVSGWARTGRSASRYPEATSAHSPIFASQLGNRGVGRLVQASRERARLDVVVARAVRTRRAEPVPALPLRVQRCGSTPPDECPCHASDAATLPGGLHRDATESGGALDAFDRAERSKRQSHPCLPATGPDKPFMPTTPPTFLPIKLGEGTRRSPMLKRPLGPSGPGCRGACGEGCPKTCENVGTYEETYKIDDGCEYTIQFPNAISCGTHAGCREHDAEFDVAKSRGEHSVLNPEHMIANTEAGRRHGTKTVSWARGGGLYDAWWIFVDRPLITRSSGRTQAGAPLGFGSAAGPLSDPTDEPRRQEVTRPPTGANDPTEFDPAFSVGIRF